MKKTDIKIVEFTPGEREVVFFDGSGNTLHAFKYAPTSPVGQCINLLIRLCLLDYKERT